MSTNPFQPIDKEAAFRRWGKIFRRLASVGAEIDLPEKLSLPQNRPAIFVGNHRSLFDLVATMAMFDNFGLTCRIQIRGDLMESGPGAKMLHSIGCIPTSNAHREEAEEASIETVKRGQLLSLMPEGRLCKPEEWVRGVGPVKPGISRIALASDAVIVPVGFSGAEKVWPRGKPPKLQWPRPRVVLRLGPAFELTSTDHRENADQVRDRLSLVLEEIGDEHV